MSPLYTIFRQFLHLIASFQFIAHPSSTDHRHTCRGHSPPQSQMMIRQNLQTLTALACDGACGAYARARRLCGICGELQQG